LAVALPSSSSLPEPALAALTGWLRCARDVVAASAAAIDAINVFPAPDTDTGTNVTQTLTGIVDAAAGGRVGLSRAAVVSAHGNSGAVIGQMVAIAVDRLPATSAEPCGRWLAATLRAAADAATAAVAEPVRGTVLTVADAAADAAGPAGERTPDDALAVARVAERAAAEALERTTEQLRPLRDAGVVDAGDLAYLLLLRALVEVLGGERARPVQVSRVAGPAVGDAGERNGCAHSAGDDRFEVMYLLESADPAEFGRLRERLSAVADSVVVVTARTPSSTATAQVHAHLARPESALAPGLAAGTVTGLRVTPLGPAGAPASRQPLVIIDDPGYGELIGAHGGVPLVTHPVGDETSFATRLSIALARSGPDVIMVVPDGAREAARSAIAACAGPSGDGSRRVEQVPAGDPVQALCALAVHEPTADLTDAAAAMRAAAQRVRTGTAELVEDGWRLITRLGGAEAELITIIAGPAGAAAAAELGHRVAAAYPRAELEQLTAGRTGSSLLIGVES
jgi:dihydroxyacetone kinase-like predicted kinase